ncbi:Uncharacterized protein Fot_12121 [Forsythia ovata]|uniref:Uncharacterized protein n=1 Tax=Forsythia ovata TaxID=205694 RepID=A0ABD1WLM2_9LAMI
MTTYSPKSCDLIAVMGLDSRGRKWCFGRATFPGELSNITSNRDNAEVRSLKGKISNKIAMQVEEFGHDPKSGWNVRVVVQNTVIIAPVSNRSSGRPHDKRLYSVIEVKRTLRCSRCMKYGHN